MTNDSPQTSAEPGPEPGERRRDPLDELDARIRAAQESAERLVREATEAAHQAAADEPPDGPQGFAGERPPPRGYAAVPGDKRGAAEAQALVALLELARTLVPAELRQQLGELVREILLAVRAIVDWYLERLDARRRGPVEVEDIPIS